MRQVPSKKPLTYALIGSGTLSKHWAFYLQSEGIPFARWARNPAPEFNTLLVKKNVSNASSEKRLKQTIESATHVLLLISDKALSLFLKKYPFLYKKTLIHCSGMMSLPHVHSVHPLMSFTSSLYSKSFYRKIYFITEIKKASFKTLFPSLKNRSHAIDSKLKPLYHAYCVTSGNFTSFLWQNSIEKMKHFFQIPEDALTHYMKAIFLNLKKDYKKALTGPLVRKDMNVIKEHFKALKGKPLEAFYKAFLDFYFKEKKTKIKKSMMSITMSIRKSKESKNL